MKKYFNRYLFLLLFSMLSEQIIAQSNSDCYLSYRNRGDTLLNRKNYDQAIQQYQQGKLCPYLTDAQRADLDQRTIEANRRKKLHI